MNKKERTFRRSYPGWKSDDEPIILSKVIHCDKCGQTITNLSEKNYCVNCYNKVNKSKIVIKVDKLTNFAGLCVNLGCIMIFVGIFWMIWSDSDFIHKFVMTGIFLVGTAIFIYFIQSLAE